MSFNFKGILMSSHRLKLIDCVRCVVFMSPLYFVTLIVCVDLITSSYLEESTMTLSDQNNPSKMNSSHSQNIRMDQSCEKSQLDKNSKHDV